MKKESSHPVKIAIFVGSLLLTLITVEVALRAAGHYIQQASQKEYIPEIDESNQQNNDRTYEHFQTSAGRSVMCIGDSFTNGGNVQTYDTYPFFLFKGLNKIKKMTVLNYGRCESTTFDAAERLIDFVNRNKKNNKPIPSHIVLLVGSADHFGNSFGPVDDQPIVEKKVDLNWGLRNFRIYKMFRILKYEYYRRYGFIDKLRIPYSNVDDTELLVTHIIFDRAKGIYAPNPNLIYTHDSNEASELRTLLPEQYSEGWYNEVFPKESFSAKNYLEKVTMYLTSIYAQKNRHSSIIKILIKFMKQFPVFFWQEDTLKALKYNLIQSFKLQSKYVASDLLSVLQELENSHPQLTTRENFSNFKKIIANWDKYQLDIDSKREDAWKQIIELAEEENINLILQTYPSNYTSANSMLRKIAHKYSLPLVDNHKIFSSLIEKNGREKYLYDDDHCTPHGYKIISDNVLNVIKQL